LEIELSAVETGLSGAQAGSRGGLPSDARAFSRARYTVRSTNTGRSEWSIKKIDLRNAAGEDVWAFVWSDGGAVFHGGLWLDEPAWKPTFQVFKRGAGDDTHVIEFFVKPVLVGTITDAAK
jgi:hypothetical protein